MSGRLGARPDDPNVKWLNKIGNPPIGRTTGFGGRTILGLDYCPTMLFTKFGLLCRLGYKSDFGRYLSCRLPMGLFSGVS